VPVFTYKVASLRQYVRLSRLAAGYTQEQAAERLFVSYGSIRNYESGHKIPESVIERMSIVYRVPELLDYYYENGKKAA
jgi:transcriptional regulator with XRE-family HTH domain